MSKDDKDKDDQEGALRDYRRDRSATERRLRALSSRSYRIYLGGQSLANTGSWMQTIGAGLADLRLDAHSTAVA